jgi:antitoxin component YwqK of YwqJK toxin-antitoxin module
LKFNWLIILLTFSLVSFSDPYTIKRISDANFRYEFYVTEKTVTPQKKKIYYWFKGGAIHNSESGMAGNLLDGEFLKMYHSNQLAEQGKFENGLKVGLWKTWHSNGVIETTQYWKDGYRSGDFYHYDSTGEMLEKGNLKSSS